MSAIINKLHDIAEKRADRIIDNFQPAIFRIFILPIAYALEALEMARAWNIMIKEIIDLSYAVGLIEPSKPNQGGK